MMKDLCVGYLDSFSSLSNYAFDREIFTLVTKFLNDEILHLSRIENLQAALTYRIRSANMTSEYKNITDLRYANCEEFDSQS